MIKFFRKESSKKGNNNSFDFKIKWQTSKIFKQFSILLKETDGVYFWRLLFLLLVYKKSAWWRVSLAQKVNCRTMKEKHLTNGLRMVEVSNHYNFNQRQSFRPISPPSVKIHLTIPLLSFFPVVLFSFLCYWEKILDFVIARDLPFCTINVDVLK